ncbi:MAG: response regulator [Planctomycetota bacterium]
MDDQKSHRNVVTFNLMKAGFRVSEAASATRALMLAEREHFDLVITDYFMPDYTGTDLARKLREIGDYASTPIILLTGRADELNLQHVRKASSVFVMAKPFSVANLMDMVSKCLALARSAC